MGMGDDKPAEEFIILVESDEDTDTWMDENEWYLDNNDIHHDYEAELD
jgi:hypothetical protein